MADPPTPPLSQVPGPGANIEKQTIEALKAIGKALGQMALYKVGHPAVAETIAAALDNLGAAVALTPDGQLVVSLDQQKLIANGKVVGTASQLPNSIVNLFNRFKLTSLTFKAGLSHAELAALCELASLRPDAPQAGDPKGFLAERGVQRVIFNEAVYLKADDKNSVVVNAAPAARATPADPVAAIGAMVDELDTIQAALNAGALERTLVALVEKAVPDPVLRQKVIAQVLKLLEQDIAKRVDEVTVPLKREKKSVENEVARTNSVIDNMMEGVVVVDEQGKILMMNQAAEQIYGTTLAQAAGKPLYEKAGGEVVVTLANELQAPGDRDIDRAVKFQGGAETARALRSSSAVVKTEQGKVVGMVTALPDKAKFAELQKMQRDFVAHVTHELRAPLSSIRAALEIIQTEFGNKMEGDESRMLQTAVKNSDRLADMINGILDFSKIESGQMTVFPKPVEPQAVAAEAVESLRAWAQKTNVALSLEAPAGLPLVDSDSPRTVQVLINLLSNAIKFTPAGGRIAVKLSRRVEGAAASVLFSVSDTGPGIPKEEQKRVFEKFVQIASGETHVGGTGLGLSIAKALVHLQKGTMWLESEPGKGATFHFTLPVHVAVPGEAAAGRAATPAAAPASWWKRMLGLG